MDNIINNILNFFQNLAHNLISVLPTSPFRAFINSLEDITALRLLNWVLPIDTCIAILEAWCVAIAVYYAYMLILRWVKAIE